MTHIFYFPELLYFHTGAVYEASLKTHEDRKIIFESFLLGKNLRGLGRIKDVAGAVLRIPKERLRTITTKEFVDEFLGGDDQEDYSGNIV